VTNQKTTTEDFELDPRQEPESSSVADQADLPLVEVQIAKIAERQRQITATVHIPHSVERVWKVLTDYETLADFIPNLTKSRLLQHPEGGIRLEQIGSQRFLNVNFCARVVLDLQEYFPSKINFQMVEGDFKGFSGYWCLEPHTLSESIGTNLCYSIQIWPKLTMPVSIIENRLGNDLRSNLLAIYQRVNYLANLHP